MPLRKNWIHWAWIILAVFIFVTRFYQLDQRAMSHDESLHAYYSWIYAEQRSYEHNPMMHGPLLFHVNALMYRVFGATDFTARMFPAFMGAAAILLLAGFRRLMGNAGAFFGAAMLAISPDIMFYSRYIRNDIYIIFLSLCWVLSIFQYLHNGKRRWLVLLAGSMALSFACKEVSFIHGALFGGWLVVHTGLVIYKRKSVTQSLRGVDMCVLMPACILPFAMPLMHYALGWDPLDYSTAGLHHTILGGSLLLTLGILMTLIWFGLLRPRWEEDRSHGMSLLVTAMVGVLLFWTIEITLYTSLFTHLGRGTASGIAGSLGYWLAQHGEKRGGQPIYYYVMLLVMYGYFPLIAFAGALIHRMRHRVVWQKDAAAEEPDFQLFCIYWFVIALIGYSLAGERMPWLLTHITLPLCLVGGIWIGQLFQRAADEGTWGHSCAVLLIPFLAFTLLHLPSFPLVAGLSPILFGLGLLLSLLAGLSWLRSRQKGMALLGGLLLLSALGSLRDANRLCFVTFDLAVEPMVYAHGAPDVKPLVRQVKEMEQTLGTNLPVVAYDQECAWPMTWYFRDTANQFFINASPALLSSPLIVVGSENTAVDVRMLTEGLYTEQTGIMVWWPVQDYQSKTLKENLMSLTHSEQRTRLFHIWKDRDYGIPYEQWPLRHEMTIFTRKELTPPSLYVNNLPKPVSETDTVSTTTSIKPDLIIRGLHDGKLIRSPRAVCVGPDQEIYVADTGNHRVLIFDAQGRWLRTIQATPALNEPWGIAVAADGTTYVSDTWNGRIRVFDAEGREIRAWGQFGQASDPAKDPQNLYGPRGLTLISRDTLAVADTGNNRILLFHSNGSFKGVIAGPLKEPVSISSAPDGTMVIANLWNLKIDVFAADFSPLYALSMPQWNNSDAGFKPYCCIDSRHRVYASNPVRQRIDVFSDQGAIHAAITLSGTPALKNPTGLFTSGSKLYIADADNHRVVILPLPAASRNTDDQ